MPATLARSTDGSVPTKTTNPPSAQPAERTCTRGPSPIQRQARKHAVSTIATLAPETADRCESPVSMKSSCCAASCNVVSPSTIPGIRPWDASPTEASTASRKFSATRTATPSASVAEITSPLPITPEMLGVVDSLQRALTSTTEPASMCAGSSSTKTG